MSSQYLKVSNLSSTKNLYTMNIPLMALTYTGHLALSIKELEKLEEFRIYP
jgi:hypothetical protein